MCSDVKITQKVLPGAGGNTVVANQNNYGLTVTEATQMAFQIFREYYPQLQKEALEAVQKLTEERLKMIPTENIVHLRQMWLFLFYRMQALQKSRIFWKCMRRY